jgi:hypothetical protein
VAVINPGRDPSDGNKPLAVSEERLKCPRIRHVEVWRCGLVSKAGKGCTYGR